MFRAFKQLKDRKKKSAGPEAFDNGDGIPAFTPELAEAAVASPSSNNQAFGEQAATALTQASSIPSTSDQLGEVKTPASGEEKVNEPVGSEPVLVAIPPHQASPSHATVTVVNAEPASSSSSSSSEGRPISAPPSPIALVVDSTPIDVQASSTPALGLGDFLRGHPSITHKMKSKYSKDDFDVVSNVVLVGVHGPQSHPQGEGSGITGVYDRFVSFGSKELEVKAPNNKPAKRAYAATVGSDSRYNYFPIPVSGLVEEKHDEKVPAASKGRQYNFSEKQFIRLKITDTSGHPRFREMNRHHYMMASAFVFVVDSTRPLDHDHLRELQELRTYVHDAIKRCIKSGTRRDVSLIGEMPNIPVVVVLTKTDAVDYDEIREKKSKLEQLFSLPSKKVTVLDASDTEELYAHVGNMLCDHYQDLKEPPETFSKEISVRQVQEERALLCLARAKQILVRKKVNDEDVSNDAAELTQKPKTLSFSEGDVSPFDFIKPNTEVFQNLLTRNSGIAFRKHLHSATTMICKEIRGKIGPRLAAEAADALAGLTQLVANNVVTPKDVRDFYMNSAIQEILPRMPLARKVISGLVCAALGAGIGAGIGFFIAGPVGAAVGAAIGFVVGGVVGYGSQSLYGRYRLWSNPLTRVKKSAENVVETLKKNPQGGLL